MESVQSVTGQIVDITARRVYPGRITVHDGRIRSIRPTSDPVSPGYVMPGFIDAHVHIESSMLVPSAFAALAVRHGTIATVSDPHEIANVLGLRGVEYMLEDGARVPFDFAFGAPSCVPATPFESAGAVMGPEEVAALLADPRILYLSEMMNYPGVIHGDPGVLAKIEAAKAVGKPVDGHAPLLRGEPLRTYVAAGISTDHEAVSSDEAREKLDLGMKIAIREGSAARNFDALIDLLPEYPGRMMLCSDDKHPDELERGHINRLVARAVTGGLPLWDVLQAACLTPRNHYGLSTGRLIAGDPATWIRVDDLSAFEVRETVIAGNLVASHGSTHYSVDAPDAENAFVRPTVVRGDLALRAEAPTIRVIRALDGEIVTGDETADASIRDGMVVSDPASDILKLVVVNRYGPAPPAIGFIRGFGLKRGALASTVAHDSHNIVAVGVSDDELMAAIEAVSKVGGGIAAVSERAVDVLPLPVAGLMSIDNGETVASDYKRLDAEAKAMGSQLGAPFMTLSFMALLVIPSLKLGDKGLFDGSRFEFADVFVR